MSQLQSHSMLPYEIGDRPVPGYTLRRYLGGGAIGHVWLAENDSGFQQAIKVIDLRESGGRKEFRGLRTVKQRRLLSGNLLTLIDYWLKDAAGKIIPDLADGSDADSFFGRPVAPPPDSASGSRSKPKQSPAQGTLVQADEQARTLQPPPAKPVTAGAARTESSPASAPRPVQLIVAMELGTKTLFDRLKECQADGIASGVPLEELLPYMEHAARGLDYLHREGILHRDVKPHNIMLVGDVAKVCDYGLVVTTDYDLSLTTKAYTPYYASPEAVTNKPLTGRTDQYSLAVAYAEARTGRLPYANDTAPSVYLAKETGHYELQGIANPAARRVLKRALAKNSSDRFATCLEFVQQLAKAERTRMPASFATRFAAAIAAILLLGACAALAYPPSRAKLLALIPARAVLATTEDVVTPAASDSAPLAPAPSATIVEEAPDPTPSPPANEPPVTAKMEVVVSAPPSPAALAFQQLQQRLDQAGAATSLDSRTQAELFELFSAAQSAASEFPAWEAVRTRLADIIFKPYLTDDAPLSDSQHCEEIIRRAALINAAGPALPLVTLFAAEAEFENGRLETPAERVEQRSEVFATLKGLAQQNDAAQSALLAYGRFLFTRLIADIGAFTPSDDVAFVEHVQELLDWPRSVPSGVANWRTPRRSGQAAALIVGLAAIAHNLQFPNETIQHYSDLNRLNAKGSEGNDPEVARRLIASALMQRLQAQVANNAADRSRLLGESLDLHRQTLKAVAQTDPFRLAGSLHTSVSLVHLDAARFTPITAADESRHPTAGDARFAELTKHDHLERAAQFANLASRDSSGDLPAEALVAVGLAQEELACQYKLIDNYAKAIAAFQGAIEASRSYHISGIARTCQGRCEFRAGLDARELENDAKSQQEKFAQAQASLAVAHERTKELDPRTAAEAHWWLGQLFTSAARNGPSDLPAATPAPISLQPMAELKRLLRQEPSRAAAEKEISARLRHYESATQHFEQAARLARDHGKSDWPTILKDGLQTRLDLAEHLRTLAAYAPQLERGALLEGIAADAQKLLDAARQQPDAVGPANAAAALIVLAAARKELPVNQPGGPSAALEALRDGEALFDQASDDWRAQRVAIILQQVKSYQKAELSEAEKEVERAEAIAREIQDARLSMQARGNCLQTHADAIFEARVSEIKTPLPRDVYLSFDQAQRLYVQAEAALARADDPRTEPNLKRLRGQKSLNLKNGSFRPDFTELEKHKLKQFISRTFELRERAGGALTLLIRGELGRELQLTQFSESASPLARSFSNLLIPTAYAGIPLEPNLAAILQTVEHKLSLEGPR